MATKLWKFLNTDIRELNWGQGVEVTKTGAEAAKAVFDLAKAVNEQKSKVQDFKPYVQEISSLLDVLNAPLGQIAGAVIPFAPVAITILKLIIDVTKKEPSLEKSVALVSQVAYLECLQVILNKDNPQLLQRFGNQAVVSQPLALEIQKLGELEIDEQDAKVAIAYFHESQLAAAFNNVLQQRLQVAGLPEAEAKLLSEKVAINTQDYLIPALVEVGESVKRLVQWYSAGGKEQLEKYLSIDDYLEREIKPKPDEYIFDETQITFKDLYVPLQVQQLNDKGEKIRDAQPVGIEEWVKTRLNEDKQKPVLFIQGEAGRGKSVFCRMFADLVRRELHPTYTPILIRLRDLRVLDNNLTDTLGNYLEGFDFVSNDSGWLTDKNTRFLFLLDGFDELLLEGRSSGGLKEFLEQVEQFQKHSHHRFIVTGRPLSLQGVERLLSQTKSLQRVELQSMDDTQRETWLQKWAVKVGTQECSDFQQFLQSCPQEVKENLAREPLLLYLLGRMHREGHLNAQMFADAKGIQAKIRIYDESVKWVLEKQRDNENLRLAGLECDDLRDFLTEAALCVVQSGNESAKVAMLEARLKDDKNPAAELIKEARRETPESLKQEKLLNNLLAAFYIKPASGDKGGAVEFVHKSFGEFLFAERLAQGFEDWTEQLTKRQRQEYRVSTEVMDKQIYDLLGYGNLTPEIVEYLMGLMVENSTFGVAQLGDDSCGVDILSAPNSGTGTPNSGTGTPNSGTGIPKSGTGIPKSGTGTPNSGTGTPNSGTGIPKSGTGTPKSGTGKMPIPQHNPEAWVRLFERLQHFYVRWCEGKFIDAALENVENLPQWKMKQLQEQLPDRDKPLGLRQVDVYTGLNVMILLFELHRYGQGNDALRDRISFHPCGQPGTAEFDGERLLCIFGYSQCLGADAYRQILGDFLRGANLSDADLRGADLNDADLRGAELIDANLRGAKLWHIDLRGSDLNDADLRGAELIDANLRGADLRDAFLDRSYLMDADLSDADLRGANLSGANFIGANLSEVKWDNHTKWAHARRLHEAVNVPPELLALDRSTEGGG
ncbi:MAG: pentapeptide repeat-containing protein [Nostocaceae cyanobacterium]|nr:pentapeptide repeat-containing protein [Nostocaceae cyanobacterium]